MSGKFPENPRGHYSMSSQIILLGLNDCCLPPDPRGVLKAKYGQNIRDMIMLPTLRAQNPKIILITPPPPRGRIQETPVKGKIRDEDTVLEYGQELKRVGETLQHLGVYVCDLFAALMRATKGGDRSKFYAPNDGKYSTDQTEESF